MTKLSDTPRTLRSDIVFTFALALACYLAWLIRDVLVLLYVSALFAVVLTPVVRFTSSVHISRWQPFKGSAIFMLLLVAAGALAAFGFLALPPVIRDFQGFAREMPTRVPSLLDKLNQLPIAQHLDTADLNSRLQGYASQAATYLLFSISDWAGKLFDLAMGFILTIYFILEGDHAYRWFLSFFPHGPANASTAPSSGLKFAWASGCWAREA
jgi:predicted PurR-regulated permease PerM